MQRLTVGAVVAALVLIAPDAANASEMRSQVEVSLADVDTATDRGAAQALRRIRDAAEAACDVRPGLQPYHERAAARACVAEAVSRAVDDLGNPLVTARHRGGRTYASAGERS
jgi:UrcA family protein